MPKFNTEVRWLLLPYGSPQGPLRAQPCQVACFDYEITPESMLTSPECIVRCEPGDIVESTLYPDKFAIQTSKLSQEWPLDPNYIWLNDVGPMA